MNAFRILLRKGLNAGCRGMSWDLDADADFDESDNRERWTFLCAYREHGLQAKGRTGEEAMRRALATIGVHDP